MHYVNWVDPDIDGNKGAQTAEPDSHEGMPSTKPAVRSFRLSFYGAGGEYFKIWILNLLLTVLTLGIYAAWAKVRSRRYFYAQTRLMGHPFEYLANPIAILKGNLIIGGSAVCYVLAGHFLPWAGFAVMGIFYLIIPFLIYKSLRFYAHNSSYRNIRFHFRGTLPRAYVVYLLYPILIPLTLGLIVPYWSLQQKRYVMNNIAYGTTKAALSAKAGFFYRTYLKVFFTSCALALVGIALIVLSFHQFAGTLHTASPKAEPFPMMTAVTILSNVITFFYIILLQQFLYARLTNYTWSVTKLGTVRFECGLKARELMWIQITNLLAMIVSLGLLVPWAKIRKTRYILENITVKTDGDLAGFMASSEESISAVGDAATDIFDVDIGL